ncbi:MAG: leucine-rich repeat protein, partial [Lachnospiraceae bacterium]|nr:leucine-rich repeat protein [Lachnospiraceae bacterium]
MFEWIITSSILILVIVAIRYILKGKISLRLQYALWALVLARLLIPFSIGNSSISVLNFTGELSKEALWHSETSTAMPEQIGSDIEADTKESAGSAIVKPDTTVNTGINRVPERVTGSRPGVGTSHEGISRPSYEPITTAGIVEMESTAGEENISGDSIVNTDGAEPVVMEPVDIVAVITNAAMIIWIVGMVLVGGYFVIVNADFTMALEKDRKLMEKINGYPLPVYFTGSVETPCMHGLINPKIYVTAEATSNEQVLKHVLEHESTHYRHGDHIWCVLRAVALAVHWYNPLVWLAAVLSRNDAELACDEGTIKRIGEEERAEYGRTLIGLTCQKRSGLFVAATTMTGSKKSIKERIVLIAKKPKMAIYTLIAVVMVVAAAVGCTFTGADKGGDTTQESTDAGEGDEQESTMPRDSTTPADEQPTTSKTYGGDADYRWRIEGDTITFTGSGTISKGDWCDKEFKHVVILSSIEAIEEGAFSGNKNLESVVLPNSIRKIEAYTFDGCENLKTITLPQRIDACGEYAFRDTLWLKNKLARSKVVNTANVLIYAAEATGSVTIPSSVTVMADYAFYGNRNIESVTLPEGLEVLGEKAFYGCEKLSEINFGNINPVELSADMFTGTAWLNNNRNENSLVIASGILIDGSAATGKVVIPSDVHTICHKAFYNNDGITEVIIPKSVDTIGNMAFYDCDAIESVTIENRYVWIRDGILGECDKLKVIRGNGTSNAKHYADEAKIPYEVIITYDWRINGDTLIFSGKDIVEVGDWIDEEFKHVVMEPGITEISYNAFDYLQKVESIVFPSTYEMVCLYGEFPKLKEVIIEEGVELITESAFAECKALERVVIPESVTEIVYWTFAGCTSLKEIVIPETVTDIGIEAFVGTPWLEMLKAASPFVIVNGVLIDVNEEFVTRDMVIPDGVKKIVLSTFKGIDKLTSVTIPESVELIYGNGFDWYVSPELKVIYGRPGSYAEEYAKRIGVSFEEMKDYTWRIEDDTIIFSGTGTVEKSGWEDESFTKVVFEDGIEAVRNFEQLTNIESVTFGKGLTYVDEWGFAGCTNLKEIVFTDTPVSFGYDALAGVPWLEEKRKENSLVIINGVLIDAQTAKGDVVVPEGVTEINSFAFANEGNEVTSVVLPTTLEYVGWRAFCDNDKLTKVTILGGNNYSIERDAFASCSSLKEINFGKGLTSIGVEAFLGCISLTRVVLPDGCTDIWERAFESCTNLKEIVIPDSVTNIGGHAFIETAWLNDRRVENPLVIVNGMLIDGVTATGRVVIPSGVTRIVSFAFGAMSYYYGEEFKVAIEEVVIPEGVTKIDSFAFEGCYDMTKVTIPSSITSGVIEDAAFTNEDKLTIYGRSDSYAEQYAEEIGAEYEILITYDWNIEGDTLTFTGTGKLEEGNWINEDFKHVIIGEGINELAYGIFRNCDKLESVTFPSSLKVIYGFAGCNNLKAINFAEGNEWIEECAFETCTSLEKIVIPKSVTQIMLWAFAGCTNLKEVVLLGNSTHIGSGVFAETAFVEEQKKNGGIAVLDGMLLDAEFTTGDVVIPEGITDIETGAFALNENITSVTLPESLKVIGDKAFAGCTNLAEVIFEGAPEYIGVDAFNGCDSLTEVALPDGIEELDMGAFSVCLNLKKVVIPESVTWVGDWAFEGCTNLKEIVIAESCKGFGFEVFKNTAWLADRQAENPLVIVNGVLVDGSKATGKVVIPEGVTAIAESVFYEAENIVEIVIPEGVT